MIWKQPSLVFKWWTVSCCLFVVFHGAQGTHLRKTYWYVLRNNKLYFNIGAKFQTWQWYISTLHELILVFPATWQHGNILCCPQLSCSFGMLLFTPRSLYINSLLYIKQFLHLVNNKKMRGDKVLAVRGDGWNNPLLWAK